MQTRVFVLVSILWLVTAVSLMAQGITLALAEPDVSGFPQVRVHMRAVGPANAPLSQAELDNLRLRENGVPISEFDVRYVPVGADIIFVLDADTTLLLPDVDDTARLEMVREAVGRYATRFMSPSGLDRVSVIVPNQANTRGEFLVQAATTPEDVINALATYDPQNLAEAGPINEQVLAAITYAAEAQPNGRYQAILLLSEARRLSQFLAYPVLVADAQAAGVPIFVGILGPEAALEDIGNAAALADPTGGFYVHMPRAVRADTVYLRWQQESNQPQITYRSLLRESGVYSLTVNLGQVVAATELDLTIEPPEAAIVLGKSVIRRAGTAVDTPLLELQPTVQPVPIQITWPDGRPRRLTRVEFRVNNVIQPQLDGPQPDAAGVLTLHWRVHNADVGVYELAIMVEDELGYTAVADPLIVTVAVERPLPPTPTPAPTPTPPPAAQVAALVALPRHTLLTILAGLGLAGLVLVMLRVYKRYRERLMRREAHAERYAALQRIRQKKEAAIPATTDDPLPLTLLWLDETMQVKVRLPIDAENVTLGREAAAGQISLADRSVSPLHARIRQRHGRYWLYDEGSESGTFLNHERLGLSPRPLADADLIQLARVSLRVHLRPLGQEDDEPEPTDEPEPINAPLPEAETQPTQSPTGEPGDDLESI